MNQNKRDFIVTLTSAFFFLFIPSCRWLTDPQEPVNYQPDQAELNKLNGSATTVKDFISRVYRRYHPVFSWNQAQADYYLTGWGAYPNADFHYWVKPNYQGEWQFASVAMTQYNFNPKIQGLMIKRGTTIVLVHQPIATL